jgi:hypothetical protein
MNRTLACLCIALSLTGLVVGCAGARATTEPTAESSGSETTAPEESAPTPPVLLSEAAAAMPLPTTLPTPDVAMRVQSQPGASGWFAGIDIERRADGSVYFRGRHIGWIREGRIFTVDGQPVPLNGRIQVGTRARREHVEILPDGAVGMDAGRLTVDPQGEVLLTRRGGASQPVRVRIEGYRPDAIGLADILLMLGIMKADLATR